MGQAHKNAIFEHSRGERAKQERVMSSRRYIDATRIPSSMEGFYATNNQFQKAGPKGFIQVKVLENKDLYVRVDLPGVADDAIKHSIDNVSQKIVSFSGESLMDHHGGVRKFSGIAGLSCDCCVITNVKYEMKDGVLRLILSRVKRSNTDEEDNNCTLTLPPFTGKSGRQLEDHPFVVKGRKGAFLAEPTEDGGLYFTVDVPGASPDDIKVELCDSQVRFYAEIKNVFEHDKDECGRIYTGSIANSPLLPSTITPLKSNMVFLSFILHLLSGVCISHSSSSMRRKREK